MGDVLRCIQNMAGVVMQLINKNDQVRSKRRIVSFWNRICVDRSTECWEWKGGYDRNSEYGVLTWAGKSLRAHRVAWALHWNSGEMPHRDSFVCHRCDNPACCNPDHLFLGTAADNVRDMVSKGRNRHGEMHDMAKLTDAEVRAIRVLGPSMDHAEIARRFNITERYVKAICLGTARKPKLP
jgi:hypothetical protein